MLKDEAVQADEHLRDQVANYVELGYFNIDTPAKIRVKRDAALEKVNLKYQGQMDNAVEYLIAIEGELNAFIKLPFSKMTKSSKEDSKKRKERDTEVVERQSTRKSQPRPK